MRPRLRNYLADHETIVANRWLAPFASTLLHPRLWHLNRRSAAGAVASGLFCGLIPGPFQMLGAAVCAIVFRVNLPLALLTTLYTNPLTIVPLYLTAFGFGQLALATVGQQDDGRLVAPPSYGPEGLLAWAEAVIDWLLRLGRPLAIGLLLLASLLALTGYLLVRIAWRLYLVRAWRQRPGYRHPS